jgi:phosphomannomutase
MSGSDFRAYDIRGNAELELPNALAERLGHALAEFVRQSQSPRLAVCRDARRSSARRHHALICGPVRGGARVLDRGVGPSPELCFATQRALQAALGAAHEEAIGLREGA